VVLVVISKETRSDASMMKYGSMEGDSIERPVPRGYSGNCFRSSIAAGLLAVLGVTMVATAASRAYLSPVTSASPVVVDEEANDDDDAAATISESTVAKLWTENCAIIADSRFTPEVCGPPDSTLFCPYLCAPGSACYDVCGVACGDLSDSWAAYCLMSAFANLEAVCAGTFVAAPPDGGDPPAAGGAAAAPAVWNLTAILERTAEYPDGIATDCGTHAVCTACDDMKNEDCAAVFLTADAYTRSPAFEKYAETTPWAEVRSALVWMALPAMLEPAILDDTCALRGYPRAPPDPVDPTADAPPPPARR